MCDQNREFFDWPPANHCVYVLKFCVCEHGMSCTLEINSNGGSKQGHVESCPSSTKNIVSPQPQCIWPQILAGCWLILRRSKLCSHVMLWSRDLTRPHGKRKLFYFPYQSTYGHQIWQDSNFPWWAPTYKVTWAFNYMV